jgi:hypothetical protein
MHWVVCKTQEKGIERDFFKPTFVGDSCGAVSYFLLAGNCEFVVDMYFTESK